MKDILVISHLELVCVLNAKVALILGLRERGKKWCCGLAAGAPAVLRVVKKSFAAWGSRGGCCHVARGSPLV
jgi:hypothetical protein